MPDAHMSDVLPESRKHIALRDPQLQQALERNGIVSFPLLESACVARLAAAYHALVPRPGQGFTATLLDADPKVRRAAHHIVHDSLQSALAELTVRLRIVNGGFAVRSAASVAADMPLHQDWSFVDEFRVRSYGVWIPLVDVDADSGCLEVVAGSHASEHPLRAPGDAFGYPQLQPLLQRYLSPVVMRAGDAAIFDQRLFHRSAANRKACDRIAAAAVLIPQDEPLQRCFCEPDGRHWLLPVDDDHYLEAPVFLN